MTRQAAHDRETRRLMRAKVASLREALRRATAGKRVRMQELVRTVRAERLALRDRLRAHRARTLAELRTAAETERRLAREDGRRRIHEARQAGDGDVLRLRGEVLAARTQANAERKIANGLRADRASLSVAVAPQSDDEVRALIPRALVPLFDRVARSVRGTDAETRAEVFLRYAETHPHELFEAVEPRAHAHVETTHGELADTLRAAARGEAPNSYAEKRAARIERMRTKAARLASDAERAHTNAGRVAAQIPMGQPILIGHHSQRRHERDLDRMRRSFTKSVALTKEAKELARRADRAEQSTAVSSEDPDAEEKLREKLAVVRADRERMRAANTAVRAGGDVLGALAALGFREAHAKKLLEPDFAGRIGFPDYALRNAAAESARLERRIAVLAARASTPRAADVVIGDARISEAENRVRITFPRVPPETVRRALKSAGFRWAPSVGAWQRQASNGARHAAERVLSEVSSP